MGTLKVCSDHLVKSYFQWHMGNPGTGERKVGKLLIASEPSFLVGFGGLKGDMDERGEAPLFLSHHRNSLSCSKSGNEDTA